MPTQRNAYIAAIFLSAIFAIGLTSSRAHCEVFCANPRVNAGVVYTGTRLRQSFELCNRGNRIVEIGELRASCGCLSPRLSRRILNPHEIATVELEINTLSQAAGPNNWTVRVRYQDGGVAGESTLQLSAQLVSEVVVEPAAMVLLAERAAGHELAITDTRLQPFTLTAARSSCPSIKPRIIGPLVDKEGHRTYRIALEISDKFPQGRHDDTLEIQTDDAKYPQLHVPLTIVKRNPERITGTPDEVDLAAPEGQPIPSRIVLIRDAAASLVKIEEVHSDDPALTCTWADGPNAMATLRIRLDHTLIHSHTFSSAVHVRIASPVQETLTIPVRCTIR
jgi:hypothetical protein